MTDTAEEKTELTVDDLFGLLGSETRMAIMRALWEELTFVEYVTETMPPLSFSALRKRAGTADPGNFNYHLQSLEGVTVERTDDGYLLTPLGYNLMRMIDRYASFEYQQRSPTVLDRSCPFCDGELVGRYERELLHVRCQECWGIGDDGTINYVQIPSPSRADIELSLLLDIATMEMEARIRYTETGLCPECFAELDREITVCDEHAPDNTGRCGSCPNRFAGAISATCPACGWGGGGPALEFALLDPTLRTAFDEVGRGPQSAGPWAYRLNALARAEESQTNADDTRLVYQFEMSEATIDVEIEQ